MLDVGCGSGVLLAAAGMAGACELCGVDIEGEAVIATRALLGELGFANRSEAHEGHLYEPVAGRVFDIVVANPPHFPIASRHSDTRHPSWSAGGPEGRALLDPFLAGLDAHLASSGRAFLVHNAFLGLAATREVLSRQGLSARIVDTVCVFIPPEKAALMTPSVSAREGGRSIHHVGPYTFAEVYLLVIGRDRADGPDGTGAHT